MSCRLKDRMSRRKLAKKKKKREGEKKRINSRNGHLRPNFLQHVVISLIDGLQTRFQLVRIPKDPHKINIFLGGHS